MMAMLTMMMKMVMLLLLLLLLTLFTWMEENDVQLGAEENDKADHCRQTGHKNKNTSSR